VHCVRTAVGKLAVGFTTSTAPLDVRMWFSQGIGFDAGLGIVLNGNQFDVDATEGRMGLPECQDQTTTTVDFAIDGGFLFALHQADNSILFGRAGINFDRDYAQGTETAGAKHSSTETVNVNVMLGFEFFLTELGLPEIGLQAAIGLGAEVVVPPDTVADTNNDWSLGSLATDLNIVGNAQLGFHYYF